MSIRSDAATTHIQRGVTRHEALAAVTEVAALFIVFVVAFTGRDTNSDAFKSFLTILSVAIGLAGATAGALIVRRAWLAPAGRLGRVVLGGFMAFIGIYTVVHVLS